MSTKDAFFLSLFPSLSPDPSLLLAPDFALPIATGNLFILALP